MNIVKSEVLELSINEQQAIDIVNHVVLSAKTHASNPELVARATELSVALDNFCEFCTPADEVPEPVSSPCAECDNQAECDDCEKRAARLKAMQSTSYLETAARVLADILKGD